MLEEWGLLDLNVFDIKQTVKGNAMILLAANPAKVNSKRTGLAVVIS